ncbi:hypothetical protein BTO20_20095 [Mycobacterium dioxanotrophicus]|uniref:Toxin YqcG C-terminal domain-containing protein n=1 Tax=Mycobacterium dioxanotrophicus TaxID=482462 RepID=A0A1Y0C5X8_9MYCO|nr:GH-E family nuclease [Mycobacterium dioxanotrophicus]ART70532.1 hypothetical protein BTO20_20095 [Mycobacterium dioxanotrophicus]
MSAAPAGRFTIRSEIEDLTTVDFSDAAARWRTAADQSDEVFDRHRQNIASPGGTTWEGDAKDAALDRATADGVVAGNQNGVVREAAGIAEDAVTDINAAQREVVAAITTAEDDGFTVSEHLKVTDARRYDINTIVERNRAATEHAEDIRWYAERLGQTVMFAEGRLQKKAGELEGIRFEGEGEGRDGEPTVRLVDNKVVQDKPDEDRKDEAGDKPAEQATGQIGPFAVPKSVEDAAKKSGLKPGEKPPATTGDVGGDLGDLLGANDPPAAGAEPKPTAAPAISPQAVEQFKTQARNLLRQQGVPPDQIESQVNAMVADAQRVNAALADSAAHTPAKPDTTPGPAPADTRSLGEKLGDKFNNFVNEAHDQFYNRLDSTVETLQNLTGTGGEGHPGVAESWQQLGESAVENHMKDPLHLRDPMGPLGPWGAVNGVVDDIPEMIDNPGKYAGDKMFDATAMAATAPLGAEGLLGKSVLPELGALERGALPEAGVLERGVVPVVPHTPDLPPVHHTPDLPPVHHNPDPPAEHRAPSDVTEPPPRPLPPHGEPGSYGYDVNGDRLPYANGGRPPFGPGQVEDTWHISRDEQLDQISGGRLDLPAPGQNQQWVLLHPNGPIGDGWTVENGHRLIEWQPGDPRKGLWDMGHPPGEEYRLTRDAYLRGELSYEEFWNINRDPNNFRVQDPYRNRSHIDEGP